MATHRPDNVDEAKSWADEQEEGHGGARCSCSCGRLSCRSWGFLGFLIALSAAIIAHNPRDALLLPGFFLAPLLVLWLIWGRKLRQEIPMDLVLQNFGMRSLCMRVNSSLCRRLQFAFDIGGCCDAQEASEYVAAGSILSAFGFLPGACVVMLVELILSGVFFLICFNEQLGGWFTSATHDSGGGGLRWEGAVLTASSMRLRNWRSPVTGPAGIRRTGATAAAAQDGESPQDPLQVLSKMYGITIVRTPGLYFFIFLLAYVVAAGTEETLKYVTPLRFRACRHSACPYVYLVCATACALGFSTVENIGYTFQASGQQPQAPNSDAQSAALNVTSIPATASGSDGLDEFAARAYTAYSRAVVAIAAHGLFGGIVGLGLTKKHVLGRPLHAWQVLLPSVLAHGTFDVQQMLLALEVWNVDTQGLLIVVLDGVLLLAAAVFLWRQIKGLPLPAPGQSVSVPLVDHDAARHPDADHVSLLAHQQA